MIEDELIHELADRTGYRFRALQAIEREGGLTKFERKIFGVAKGLLENTGNGDAATAALILYYLAEQCGVRVPCELLDRE